MRLPESHGNLLITSSSGNLLITSSQVTSSSPSQATSLITSPPSGTSSSPPPPQVTSPHHPPPQVTSLTPPQVILLITSSQVSSPQLFPSGPGNLPHPHSSPDPPPLSTSPSPTSLTMYPSPSLISTSIRPQVTTTTSLLPDDVPSRPHPCPSTTVSSQTTIQASFKPQTCTPVLNSRACSIAKQLSYLGYLGVSEPTCPRDSVSLGSHVWRTPLKWSPWSSPSSTEDPPTPSFPDSHHHGNTYSSPVVPTHPGPSPHYPQTPTISSSWSSNAS
ncbi:uncharacterized protein AKAME5_001929800 [Lates japonicus]|uniref:Uncharacterized protein n=1 Tax=Lates japonicus TaxID=270547 RepID=A0AAD3N8S0_LATJO|nr:uncharacterized protein AKAME5_001929800 [Lates japonicus]